MGGDITVKLSYEEDILNALSRVQHRKGDDVITRDKREFDAIREVLQPLYDERDALREMITVFARVLQPLLGGARGDSLPHPQTECPCRDGHDMPRIHGEPIASCRRCGIAAGAHVRPVPGGPPNAWERAPCPKCKEP